MGTSWAEVIVDYGLTKINDIRLTEEMEANPALFFRKMSLYMKNAIPRFSRPAEEQEWLRCVEPVYDSFEYQAKGMDGETVETGKLEFEVFGATVIGRDKFENPVAVPLEGCRYDTLTGRVTLPSGIDSYTRISMDFYTDGVFHRELSMEEKNILGMCIQLVWEGRFAGDWLSRVPKVKDKSSDMGSEANRTRADTERLKFLTSELNDTMIRYAQNLAYRNVVPRNQHFRRR